MTSLIPRTPRDALDASPGDEVPSWSVFDLLGSSGLKRSSGYVDEEFLPRLKGRKAVKVYREIGDNSPIIGGWYNAVSELLRQIEWTVEPGGKSRDGAKAAEFLEQNMHDMEHSWGDMIMEVCSFAKYGWELSEMMFKLRRGIWATNERDVSKYSDGMIGFRAIEGRAQETMLRWVFGENGQILGMVQLAAPRYQEKVIPLGKCLHFRTTKEKNNPEGRSYLRNCYEPWYYLKRLQEIEAVGASRDLAGMPFAKVPPKLLMPNATPSDKAMLDAIKRLVTSIYRNENDGIVWPWEPDEKGISPYEFELLNSGGSRQFNTDAIITRYKTEMLQALLADFLQVGHENTGSYNMHTDKTGLFRTSINSLAQTIADEFNRKAVRLLFKVNKWQTLELPKVKPQNVDPPDLTQLGAFLQQCQALGMQVLPDPAMEKFLRDAAGLPQMNDEQREVAELSQRQQLVLQVAQERMQALQMQQQAVQGQMGLEQQQQQNAQGQLQLQAAADPAAGDQQQDPNEDARGQLAVQTDKVKLAQEKAKLANLRTQGRSGPPSRGRDRRTQSRRTASRSSR